MPKQIGRMKRALQVSLNGNEKIWQSCQKLSLQSLIFNDINKLHVWSLSNDESCLTMHIKCDTSNLNSLLNNITLKLNKYKIYNITIQPDTL